MPLHWYFRVAMRRNLQGRLGDSWIDQRLETAPHRIAMLCTQLLDVAKLQRALRGYREWPDRKRPGCRSVEHTSELQSLMRISYAVFCFKKTKQLSSLHSIVNILSLLDTNYTHQLNTHHHTHHI